MLTLLLCVYDGTDLSRKLGWRRNRKSKTQAELQLRTSPEKDNSNKFSFTNLKIENEMMESTEVVHIYFSTSWRSCQILSIENAIQEEGNGSWFQRCLPVRTWVWQLNHSRNFPVVWAMDKNVSSTGQECDLSEYYQLPPQVHLTSPQDPREQTISINNLRNPVRHFRIISFLSEHFYLDSFL